MKEFGNKYFENTICITFYNNSKIARIFDEVQEAPEYAVVAAGSLLGVALHAGISFPVGKVDELHLHPIWVR